MSERAGSVAGGSLGRPAASLGQRAAVVELTRGQMNDVVRKVSGAGGISVLLSGVGDVRALLEVTLCESEGKRMSRSLLRGLLMLAAFPEDGSYRGNAEIAEVLLMVQSTAHRYISTLVAVGLLEQDPETRLYRLAR
jgi:IclR helix-turn-helix domain